MNRQSRSSIYSYVNFFAGIYMNKPDGGIDKYNSPVGFLVLILGIIGLSYFKPVFLLIFPGLLIFSAVNKSKSHFVDLVSYSIFISVAYWIVGFSFLKFIPLQITTFRDYSLYASLALVCIGIWKKQIPKITFHFDDVIWLAIFGISTFLFLNIYPNQIVAPGADMATHAYTARVIADANKFPSTHEPIVPINSFGFAPYGLEALSALISLSNQIPAYRSALVVSLLVYPFMAVALFLFLKNYFSSLAIYLVILFMFVYEDNIISYLLWGGNSTILSIAFFSAGIAYFVLIRKKEEIGIQQAFIIALLFAASFYSHQTALVAFLYFVLPVGGLYAIHNKRWPELRFTGLIFGIVALLSLSLLFSIQTLTAREIEHITEWFKNERFMKASGEISHYYTVIKNIIYWHSDKLLYLSFFGMMIGLAQGLRHVFWYTAALTYLFIFLINFQSWFLPLSPLFYPDRILTLGLIPVAYFLGALFDLADQAIRKIVKTKNIIATIFGLIWLPGVILMNKDALYFFFIRTSTRAWHWSLVTPDDMKAFDWISKNTTSADVILNNYGDAGIWIPAIAGRRIKYNDTNAHYISDVREGESRLTPTYLFIGNKVLYKKGIYFTNKRAESDPIFQLVFESVNAKVYKIVSDK